ncbi:mandelate racemase/muconate lactonizing enzyme family protein, partial [Rhizobium ruizarguesonis]
MKITGIRTFLMHVGQPDPSKWASDQRAGDGASKQFGGTRNWLFLKIDTDEGITGIGECSGWPRVVETAIHDLAPLLIGEDPAHTERLWQKMHIAMMGHGMLGTVGGGAMTGIDMALWDIKGKA